jgi:hypothetical protein
MVLAKWTPECSDEISSKSGFFPLQADNAEKASKDKQRKIVFIPKFSEKKKPSESKRGRVLTLYLFLF